jgi:hypothetical protein
MNSCPIRRPVSVCSIWLYGQRSLPQTAARVTRTSASVGSIRRASGTFSTRTSPAPYITVARIRPTSRPRRSKRPSFSSLCLDGSGRCLSAVSFKVARGEKRAMRPRPKPTAQEGESIAGDGPVPTAFEKSMQRVRVCSFCTLRTTRIAQAAERLPDTEERRLPRAGPRDPGLPRQAKPV